MPNIDKSLRFTFFGDPVTRTVDGDIVAREI